jgi:hypothetical protein
MESQSGNRVVFYFVSSEGLMDGAGEAGVVGVANGAANGAARVARRWRRVSPISEKTVPQMAFNFFSVVSASSVIRLSDC